MRIPIISTFVAAAVTVAGVAPRTAAAQAPCTRPVDACARWVVYGNGPARSMVYATYALDKPNPNIRRALIMVHGALRNADHYFETAVAAAFIDGALDNTIVIAPHLITRSDQPEPNEVVWGGRRVNWRDGGVSSSNPDLTSFDFVDQIIRDLANKQNFPNLGHIVVTGHSAGGQFTTRYAMANKVDGAVGVGISYVVANPSSYAWPTAARPLPVGDANPVDAYKEALGKDGETAHTNFQYGPFDASKAPTYNLWPKGLDSLAGYVGHMTPDQLRANLVKRTTTFLVGQVDVLPLGGFDSSPSAMAQGPTRRARGEAFVNFVNDSLGAHHEIVVVSECGHNDRCIFTTNAVLPYIFPREAR